MLTLCGESERDRLLGDFAKKYLTSVFHKRTADADVYVLEIRVREASGGGEDRIVAYTITIEGGPDEASIDVADESGKVFISLSVLVRRYSSPGPLHPAALHKAFPHIVRHVEQAGLTPVTVGSDDILLSETPSVAQLRQVLARCPRYERRGIGETVEVEWRHGLPRAETTVAEGQYGRACDTIAFPGLPNVVIDGMDAWDLRSAGRLVGEPVSHE